MQPSDLLCISPTIAVARSRWVGIVGRIAKGRKGNRGGRPFRPTESRPSHSSISGRVSHGFERMRAAAYSLTAGA